MEREKKMVAQKVTPTEFRDGSVVAGGKTGFLQNENMNTHIPTWSLMSSRWVHRRVQLNKLVCVVVLMG